MYNFSDKSVLITGGTRGIGHAIAARFAELGAKVAIVGSSVESCSAAQKSLQGFSKQAIFAYPCDVASTKDAEKTVLQAHEELGSIDILVNNAGITRDNLLLRLKEEDWDAVMNTNLKGIFNFSKPTARIMMKAKKGKIINISSVVALLGNAGQSNYAAAKAGIIGFSKSLARELAPRNIQVNVIAPGFIETQMTEVLPENVKNELKTKIPLGKIGQTKDIAEVTAFLASNAADYITGQVISVDGGMSMG